MFEKKFPLNIILKYGNISRVNLVEWNIVPPTFILIIISAILINFSKNKGK